MKRRLLFQGLVVLGILGLIFAVPPQESAAQAAKTLKIQASFPSGTTYYDNLNLFAAKVEKLTEGKLKFECLPAGAIVPALEVLDATSKGVLDAAYSAPAYWVGKNKAAALFAAAPGGPFGMDFWDYYGWYWEGGGLELYRELYQDVLKRNVVPFHMTLIAPQIFGWFKTPIKGLADVKGRKCRMGGITGDVYMEAGMRSVMLPSGEILPSAERGVIECAELSGFAEDMKIGIHQVFKYVYSPGVHEPNCSLEIFFNKGVWDNLTPLHQEIIKTVIADVSFRSNAKAIKDNALALKEAQEKHGVKSETTPKEILNKILDAWDNMVKEESAKNPIFKKIIDSQRAYAQLVVPVHRQYYPDYSFVADHYFPRTGKK